jgi:hypothetical protein
VKLDGTCGRPGHRRQGYRCTPRGGRSHVFTELLPREESWHDSCELCERQLERREGPKAPRHYQFVARGVAEALHAVGSGSSYRRASWVARDRAHRFRFDPETGELRESDHGQLVGDWVELFAPVVFEPYRPGAWPAEGSLLLDHLPFRVRALDAAGRRIPAGRVAFDVFCAVGYVAGKPRLWRAEAFATAHPANWSAFLASLPGEPKRVVCDAHVGMLQAISERWPEAERHQCEWHLQHALDRLLAKQARRNPSPELDELRAAAEGALTGRSFWRPFVRAARAVENEILDRWIVVNDRRSRRSSRADAALPSARRHAAHHLGARTDHAADRHRPLPAPLRTQEPRAPQPPADALAAPRQRRRRRPASRNNDPPLARGQRRPPDRASARDRRSAGIAVPTVT